MSWAKFGTSVAGGASKVPKLQELETRLSKHMTTQVSLIQTHKRVATMFRKKPDQKKAVKVKTVLRKSLPAEEAQCPQQLEVQHVATLRWEAGGRNRCQRRVLVLPKLLEK